jgi:ribosomal subunit interface protein
MRTPLQVTFRDIQASEATEAKIRKYVDKLERFNNRIINCKVTIDTPHRHRNKGNLYHVRIDLSIPNTEIVVNRNPSENKTHTNIYVALRDAFDAAKRQLQDSVSQKQDYGQSDLMLQAE